MNAIEADPETAGVPDFTAIIQSRRIAGELLEAIKALTKSPGPETGAGRNEAGD